MAINNVTIPFPDFKLQEVIDPDQFDANNASLVNKTNELVDKVNTLQEVTNSNTSILSLKADKSEVMTRTELIPFLQGGDTDIVVEVFTIVNNNAGNGAFTYRNDAGNIVTGVRSAEGRLTFRLEKKSYATGQNRIKAIINDALHRSTASGGLIETSPTEVTLSAPESNGTEVTFEYFYRVGVSGEHNVLISPNTPPPSDKDTVWLKETGNNIVEIRPKGTGDYSKLLLPKSNDKAITITDANNRFTAETLDGVLDELFQNANDGKTAVANAITAKGVSASPTDTFSTLATKIGQINTGKRFATGTVMSSSTAMNFLTHFNSTFANASITVTGLSFKPKFILFYRLGSEISVNGTYVEGQKWNGYQLATVADNGNWAVQVNDVEAYVRNGSFRMAVNHTSTLYNWIAFE